MMAIDYYQAGKHQEAYEWLMQCDDPRCNYALCHVLSMARGLNGISNNPLITTALQLKQVSCRLR